MNKPMEKYMNHKRANKELRLELCRDRGGAGLRPSASTGGRILRERFGDAGWQTADEAVAAIKAAFPGVATISVQISASA